MPSLNLKGFLGKVLQIYGEIPAGNGIIEIPTPLETTYSPWAEPDDPQVQETKPEEISDEEEIEVETGRG
ncbi:MAG: hypothetical protein ABSC17_06870 [Thermacetogeniaceae bacterium]